MAKAPLSNRSGALVWSEDVTRTLSFCSVHFPRFPYLPKSLLCFDRLGERPRFEFPIALVYPLTPPSSLRSLIEGRRLGLRGDNGSVQNESTLTGTGLVVPNPTAGLSPSTRLPYHRRTPEPPQSVKVMTIVTHGASNDRTVHSPMLKDFKRHGGPRQLPETTAGAPDPNTFPPVFALHLVGHPAQLARHFHHVHQHAARSSSVFFFQTTGSRQ
ncbi:hypothetical protein FDENT_13165 [Fusarium denticulatum]|uniref:Uncharacterized protein n=1 Tax=Fusarium denticulatum TaxID=48507 RepID=A0A8H5T701_9HYPO|nr:hypothetical protein FDENT_13165 [Fusarium denticulatum]